MALASITVLIIFAVALVIPVLIGVYVFRDATSRGMNAVLWTLIAVIAPSLIGFIIYLLVRGNYSNLKCGACGANIRESFLICPACGAKLKPTCPSCGSPVEPGWKVCPRCAGPLPEVQDDIVRPVKKKDRTLWKILVAVILIPVLLIIIAFIAFSSIGASTMSSGVTTLPVDEYVQETGYTQVEDWIDGLSLDTGEAGVLRYEKETEDETITQFLIYMPVLDEFPDISITPGSGFFGNTLELDITSSGESGGNTLIVATCVGDRDADLNISYDGASVSLETTDVDYPLELNSVTGSEEYSIYVE